MAGSWGRRGRWRRWRHIWDRRITIHSKFFFWGMGVLVSRPLDATHIAKLITTTTFHSTTAFALLDYHLTFYTLSIMKILLEEFNLVLIALANMCWKQALAAELFITGFALNSWLFSF